MTTLAKVQLWGRTIGARSALHQAGRGASDQCVVGARARPRGDDPIRVQRGTGGDIAGVIERPVAEVLTNPASADLMREYYKDIGAFEARGR